MTSVEVAPAALPARAGLTEARRRLYEAAITLFGDGGYHSVSVRDLAGALGVVPGAIYAHVPSKQQLLFELVLIGHEEHRDRLKDALLGAGADPVDQVRALTAAHVRAHLEFAALARVTRELQALSPEQLAVAVAVRRESEQLFRDVVERGIRLGAFDVDDPQLAVMSIAGMGIRVADRYSSDGPVDVDHIADRLATYATRLLRRV